MGRVMHGVHHPTGRILVVDDDPDVMAAVAGSLEDRGYSVDCATDGQKALALLRITPRPDVILLDLMMPRVGGEGFLRELRRIPELASVPVILMTGSQTTPGEYQSMMASALLLKPFTVKDLLGTVDLHVGIRL